jgi:hypothetical protein
MPASRPVIGVFDSGFGGLTVLKALFRTPIFSISATLPACLTDLSHPKPLPTMQFKPLNILKNGERGGW